MDGDGKNMIKGASLFIVTSSLVLGFAFNFLLIDRIPGIGFTVCIGLIVAVYIGISLYLRKPLRGDLLWLFPVLLFFASMVAFRANELLMVLNIGGCALLLLLISEVSVRGSVRQFIPFDYLKVFFPPVQFVGPLVRSFADVFSVRRYGDQKKNAQIIRGVAITAPIVILFALLFASADPLFNKYVYEVFKLNLDEETVARGIFIFLVAISLTGAYAYSFGGKPFAWWGSQYTGKRPIGQIETSILLGSVNVLFLAFILIQIAYLFGGVANIVSDGLTYAEYARRGFFELLAIAFLSYLILFGVEKFIERDAEEHTRAFKLLSTALVLQVAVIMASAFMRLSLYEQAFGFTTMRLYTHAFILLLAVVFVFLLYKILFENRDSTFAFRTFLAVLVFVGGMNLFNPDAFIAQKNLDRYEQTGKLDAVYLSGLSADATSRIISALNAPEADVRGVVGHRLLDRLNSAEQDWRSWNYSREAERAILDGRRAELEQYANFEVAPTATSSDGAI